MASIGVDPNSGASLTRWPAAERRLVPRRQVTNYANHPTIGSIDMMSINPGNPE